MATQLEMNQPLRNNRAASGFSSDRAKLVRSFLPKKSAETIEFGGFRSTQKSDCTFEGWITDKYMAELLELVQSKFQYKVEIYPEKLSVHGDRIKSWTIRPACSELATAVVWYNATASRYEIMSLRIYRDRRLLSEHCSEPEDYMLAASNNVKKAASIIAGLSPYSLSEVCKYAAHCMHSEMWGMESKLDRDEDKLYRDFYINDLGNDEVRKEILSILALGKRGEPITIAPESRLMVRYTDFLQQLTALKDKQGYLGKRDFMYVVRSSITGIVLCAYRNVKGGNHFHDPYEDAHMVSFKSFDSVPAEIKRAVMTLESLERGTDGVAANVGMIGKPTNVFCHEACGFLISTDFINEFCKLDAGVVHG